MSHKQEQLTRADVARLARGDPAALVKAQNEGRLQHILGGQDVCPVCGRGPDNR